MCCVIVVVRWLVFCLETGATASSPLGRARKTLTDTPNLSFLYMPCFPNVQAHCSTLNLGSCRVLPCTPFALRGLVANRLCLCLGRLISFVVCEVLLPLNGPPFWPLLLSHVFYENRFLVQNINTFLPSNKILIHLLRNPSSSDY